MARYYLGPFIFVFFTSASALASDFSAEHIQPTLQRASDTTSLIVVGSGILATLVASTADSSMRDNCMNNQRMSKDVSIYGDYLGTGIPGALIALSQFYFDTENGKSHIRALVYTNLVTYSLKYSFQKPRPGGSMDRLSMPSGHTSTTFATATSLTYAYGWKAASVAYPLAVFTGLSRLADDAHWLSDVVAGAFVGFWWGRASYYNFEKEQSGKTVSFTTPTYTDGRWGWAWVSHF